MQSLFPQQTSQGTAALCSFSAGKCIMTPVPNEPTKFKVTADPRRGTISLSKAADGMLHFKWANAISGVVEDDRIVFPGENVFKRVNTGKPTDRVYMLQYVSGNQRLMYWMQNKSDENDEANVKRVNEVISNPNAGAPSVAPAGGVPAAGTTVGPNEWMQLLGLNNANAAGAGGAPPTAVPINNSGFGNLDLSSLLNPAAARPPVAPTSAASAPAPTAAAAPMPPAQIATSSSSGGLTIEDLQRAMFGQAGGAAQHQQTTHHRAPETPALQDIVQAEDVIASGVLNDAAVQMELLSLLPEGQQTAEHLQTTVRSAQFRQALGSLTHAVQHPDNFQSVMSNFGINPEPGTQQLIRGDGVGAFLTSIQAANPPETTSTTTAGTSNNTTHTTTGEEKKSDEGEADGSAPMDEE